MLPSRLLRQLARIVGDEHVCAGRVDAELYSYDGSGASRPPDAVVFPADTGETSAVVRTLAEAGVPFVPRGFGTNLSGGSIAVRGGVVIGLSRLRRIVSIDGDSRCAVVEPGVTNLELQQALAPHGFFFAPDPASQKVATIGGNIGENSGGPHCLKYGVTTNHVLGATVVLPDGQVAVLGGPALDPPGLDLRGLLVGSEGTLAIVTQATVRILPLPEAVVTLLVLYDSVEEAARSVSEIIAAGIVPATLEMMDAPVMRAVEESLRCGYPLDAAAVLIIEVDGPAAGLQRQAGQIGGICRRNGCRSVREAGSAAERDLLWAGRRGAFGAIARLAPSFLVNDCTVPRSRLPEALARVAAIARQHDLDVGNVFHAGDGNLHPLLLFDSRQEDQVQRVERAGRQIMEACVALGGTISGEHGVGSGKLDAMRLVFGEESLRFQRQVKAAFDPAGRLNPGKVVPPVAEPCPPGEPSADRLSGGVDLAPATVAEACDLVRRATRDGVALLPAGSGSRMPPSATCRPGIARLRSTALASAFEHDPVNQVVTVHAGARLADLQRLLRPHRQWVPLRPPHGDRCTVGGVVALGACGPDRLRYGAPRDLALGLEFVAGTGERITGGGRVVKNVAGYDVTRLLAGSCGTLGFITAVTLRTRLLPERCLVLGATGSPAQCAAAASQLLGSSLEPTFVAAAPEGTERGPGVLWRVVVGFEGPGDVVDAQAERGQSALSQAGLRSPSRREYEPGEDPFAVQQARLCAGRFVLRAGLPPGVAHVFAAEALCLLQGADVLLDFGSGQVVVAAEECSGQVWDLLGARASDAGGHVLLERAPAGFRSRRPPCCPEPPAGPLVRRLRGMLDPRGVFARAPWPGHPWTRGAVAHPRAAP
ncbi:MAG: FAD-linked oxidase C-terminal domain-containing protein [Candidatus Latescibacterota bacterium]